MALIVQKFGGTSVGDLDRIRNVATRVKSEVDAGHQVAVVVSAMAGTTNQLVSWARDIGPMHDAREYDTIVATGEQVTVGLLAIALQNLGSTRARGSAGIPIRTDDIHGAARIDSIDCALMRERLAGGQVAVVAGFQGIAPDGRVATLGRGGSDTSAVALAAALQADAAISTPMSMCLYNRPADRPESAEARPHHLRGDAGNGLARRQGAADPLGGHGHAPQCEPSGALQLF